jgi:hypothetical protein
MNVILGIAGAVLLFVVFGLMRRGRDTGTCEGCGGGCASREACHLKPVPRRPTDAN